MFPTTGSVIDLALTPFVLSLLGLIISFHVIAPFFPDTKHSSWILTTISSFAMSVASLPFIWDYLVDGISLKSIRGSSEFTETAVRFFQAYLITDLLIGSIYYRSRISLLAGWIHHPLYVFIVELTVRRSWAHLFCLCSCMEIPTFVLGISTLYPRVRSNVFFALSFFMTRILFHVILAISFAFEHNRIAQTGGSYVPSILLTCILPLHVTWFVGCIKGFIRRSRQAQAQAHTGTASTPSPTSSIDATRGPSPAPSATRPTTISPSHAPAPRMLRLRLSHRRQSFERALRSFRYDFFESPTSRRILISNALSPYIPRRETLYEWLGQRRRRRFAVGPQMSAAVEAPVVAATTSR